MILRSLLPLFAVLVLSSSALSHAQSLYAIDEIGQVYQMNGPPAGPCGYPLGPLLSFYGYDNPALCPNPGPVGSGAIGGMSMNRVDDTLWIADGGVIAEFQTFGTELRGFDVGSALSGSLTGLAYDSSTGWLWITSGVELVAVVPGPPIPPFDCPSDAVVVAGPFPLPLVAATATALAYDPSTDALWFTEGTGNVVHVTKTGALGPLGSFDATAGGCGLSGNLRAITVDTAQAPGTLYVSDGITVAYVDAAAGGAAAPTTFYTPFACFTPLGQPIQGLVYAATGNLFGPTSGGIFPIIGHGGQSIVPNPAFTIEIAGANDGDIAFLMLSTSLLCPTGTIFGVPQNIALPAQQIAMGTVAPTGLFTAPVPLPPTAPFGLTVYLQCGLFEGGGVWSSTRGMSMTTSRP